MRKFISTLLLIPVCSLPVSMVYSAEKPDGTIRVAAISPLDLRAPDLRSAQWQDLLRAAAPADWDEVPAVAVVAASLPPEERSNTYLSLAGIGSLYWVARHPAQAWKVLLPIGSGDDSNAYADLTSQCAFIARVTSGRAACP